MRMTIEKLDPPVFSYKFQGIFIFSVFGELTKHTEHKMIIFTSGLVQSLEDFFFVNFANGRLRGRDD